MDMLSLMFNHALDSGVLYRVPLGNPRRMCHLQFANDLLVLTVGGIEDLRIIKCIIYLFEGMSGLAINFHKTSLYLTSFGLQLEEALTKTLNCKT